MKRRGKSNEKVHEQAVKLHRMTDEQLCGKLAELEAKNTGLEQELIACNRRCVDYQRQNTALLEDAKRQERKLAELRRAAEMNSEAMNKVFDKAVQAAVSALEHHVGLSDTGKTSVSKPTIKKVREILMEEGLLK